jgi:hypothetical protein
LSDAWILSRSLQYHLVATSSEGLGLKVYTPQQGENTQTRRRGAGITISMDVTDRWEHQKIKTEKTRPSSKRERVAGLKRRYGKCRVTTRRHHHLTLLIHFIHTHVCVCVVSVEWLLEPFFGLFEMQRWPLLLSHLLYHLILT